MTDWDEYRPDTYSLELDGLGRATVRRDRSYPWRLNVKWAAGCHKEGDCTELERIHDDLDRAMAEGREYLSAGPMPESERPNRGPGFPPRRPRKGTKALKVVTEKDGRLVIVPAEGKPDRCTYTIYWSGGRTRRSRYAFQSLERAEEIGRRELMAGPDAPPIRRNDNHGEWDNWGY